MIANDLYAVLRRKPFEPFRILTADGTSYDIRHPDLVWVTLTSAHIGFPDPNGAETFPSRDDIVGMRHILRLEQLAPLPTAPVSTAGE